MACCSYWFYFQKFLSNYKRKSSIGRKYASAIDTIRSEGMGWLKTTETFNVPQATLSSWCQGKNKVAKEAKTDVEETVVQQAYSRLGVWSFWTLSSWCSEVIIWCGWTKEWIWSTDSVRLISLRRPEPTSAVCAEAFIRPEMNVIFFGCWSSRKWKHFIRKDWWYGRISSDSSSETSQKVACRGKKKKKLAL